MSVLESGDKQSKTTAEISFILAKVINEEIAKTKASFFAYG